MELNINSPAYFNQHYGIDDEVYRFCQKAYLYFRDKEYSELLHSIGIMPVAAPKELYETGKWQESIRFFSNKSCAVVMIRMDFDTYYSVDSDAKVELIKKTILAAVRKTKTKGKFDYAAFERDFNNIC